jgi:putative FmdB family regulatory protein
LKASADAITAPDARVKRAGDLVAFGDIPPLSRMPSMPFYEYRCNACGHEFDKLQKLADAVLVDCPHCHQPQLVKLISAAGFRLKGGGWYETDFKSGDKKKNVHDAGAEAPKACGAGACSACTTSD